VDETTDTPLRCANCGEPILDDQTVIRLSAGVGRPAGFSHALMFDDAFLHAGHSDAGPWGDERTASGGARRPRASSARSGSSTSRARPARQGATGASSSPRGAIATDSPPWAAPNMRHANDRRFAPLLGARNGALVADHESTGLELVEVVPGTQADGRRGR
jgi:hypothetical protein